MSLHFEYLWHGLFKASKLSAHKVGLPTLLRSRKVKYDVNEIKIYVVIKQKIYVFFY